MEYAGHHHSNMTFTTYSDRYDPIILKERILDKSVEYLGKKYVSYKKKGTATKMIDNMYSGHCYYSKKVREAMKNGETPEYPPTLHVELPKYDGTFSCKFLEQTEDGGLQPFAGDFDEYVRNNNCLQSLTIACRHIWFGTKVSIKWVVTELVVNKSFQLDNSTGSVLPTYFVSILSQFGGLNFQVATSSTSPVKTTSSITEGVISSTR